MDYLYFLANASLTVRAIEHLLNTSHLSNSVITVIHQIDGWIVRVKFSQFLTPAQHGDFKAFMGELGIIYRPDMRLQMLLWGLDTGQSPIEVMRRYHLAVVSHGIPNTKDIEAFRQQFTRGLGYCPETLA